jgi:hypothetical protein
MTKWCKGVQRKNIVASSSNVKCDILVHVGGVPDHTPSTPHVYDAMPPVRVYPTLQEMLHGELPKLLT